MKLVLEDPYKDHEGADKVLLQLNLAHICTPILNFLSLITNLYEWHVLEKIFDTASIF